MALPSLHTNKPLCVMNDLVLPTGLAVSEDGSRVIVTEFNNGSVTVLDWEGKKLKSFGWRGIGDVRFILPRGIAITPDDCILVTDGSSRLQKVTMEGNCSASVGEPQVDGYRSGPHQFSSSAGIAISHTTKQIYVADRSNHRIQVLNLI